MNICCMESTVTDSIDISQTVEVVVSIPQTLEPENYFETVLTIDVEVG